VSWDVVKDIQKRDLSRRYARPKLKGLRRIVIDEIAVGKEHRYLTVVLDFKSGAVVFVGDGKSGDALKPFWKRLRRSKAKIEAVAMDMSPAYHDAVSTHLPKATIVYDRFHVIKLFNDKLSDLRRSLYHKAEDEQKSPQGVTLAPAQGRREPRRRTRRGGPSREGPGTEQDAGDGLLPEGRPEAVLGPAQLDARLCVPRRLDRASGGLRHMDA
jgi:transposase